MRFGAVHTPLLTMNKATFDGLPPAIQKIIQEVGKEWGVFSAQAIAKRHKEALTELGGKLKVVTPDDEIRKAWATALPNIPKQRFGEINKANQPGDVIYKYIEALKKAGHVFPRDWAAEK
jgi:TRAP-type C4-dicarboxylate transport system substrate-binding protein